MRQAIKTKFLGPTNHLGARIRASSESATEIFPYVYEISAEQNHIRAAQALALSLSWDGRWHVGSFEGEYFFVCEDLLAFKIKPA